MLSDKRHVNSDSQLAINLEGELDGDEQAAKPMPLIRLKDEPGTRGRRPFLNGGRTRELSGLQSKP